MPCSCNERQRRQGILIPNCPPRKDLNIRGAAEYFTYAWMSHETYKATYDCLFVFH